jgi:cellulose synthase/poly-beta-1,6-N-acetylglucosamine synthase-like glycosyltransferase
MLEIILSKIQNNPISYEGYLEYAKYLENVNLKQVYLTYENALFYWQDELVRIEIQNKLDENAYRQSKVEPASIVILSYNNRQITQQCIESIRETTPISAKKIVIVDNNSQDDSVEYLRQQNGIVLVENDFNAGFLEGVILG